MLNKNFGEFEALNCQSSFYFHEFGLLQLDRLSAYKKKAH